ncbi:hypothetical protein BV22DRAFT_1032171 [Leucogyrophana mollusca]|uniref:Uncharacterized protein n=1 Tax=Leucogyrophana mollusca TaxID=85980 RepID=A0ACB8BNL5_9AGAM|nr:hypothetical protein BV22DRAFT_1032171 [Leucogyrophana mollusca]
MAAPPSVTTANLTGRFLLNKTLSDDSDEILRLQGVSWFKRRAIAKLGLILDVKHYTDEDGIEHIDIDQTLSGGITGTSELRSLDFQERSVEDPVFGAVIGRSGKIKVNDLEGIFLKDGWTDDTIEHEAIRSIVWSDTPKSNKTWRAEQVWGFEIKDGARRYARHIKFTSPDKSDGPIHIRVYYDYLGN